MSEEKLFRKHFNLQSGEKCFLIDNKLIVSSDYRINPDKFSHNDGRIIDKRKFRVLLNVLYTIVIFTLSFYFGIYPLVILMFLVIWDLNQLNRYKHKVSNSNCISIDKIQNIDLRKGSFGFNYIDVFFESGSGLVMRPLKLYDSNEEFEIAIKSIQSIGFLKDKSSSLATGVIVEGEMFKCNNRTEIVFSNDGIRFTKDNLFEKDEKDYYLNNNIILITLLILITLFIGIKSYKLITEGINAPGVTLLVILISFLIYPYRRLNRSNANFIAYNSIVSFKKLDNYNMRIIFKNNKINLKRSFPVLHYSDFEKITSLLEEKTGKKSLK